MDINRGWMKLLLLGFLILIAGCSGGGGGGVDGSGLEGTAAVGSPIGNAEIVVKGANGVKKTTTTKPNGKFKIKLDGLEAPYLLKINVNSEKRLYSLASKEGTNNINPFSDVVARNWFKSRGRDIDEEFDNGEPIGSPPLATEISALIEAVNNLLDAAYGEFLENKDGFDFQHVEFNADGTGFDRLLDYARFNIKQGKVTIKLVDPDGGFEAIIILNFDLSNDLSDPDALPPAAPNNLVAFPVSDSEVVLVWNPATDNVGVAGYRVYRNNDNSNAFPVTTAFPVFSDTGLETGSEYCYTVEAFDGAGSASTATDEVCVTPQPVDDTPPDAITNLNATAKSDTEISLIWTPSASNDVIGYDILRGVSGAVNEKIATVVPSSYGDFNLAPETEYCYIVKAFDATGLRSAQSSEACATTESVDNKPNAAPQINAFSVSPNPANPGTPVSFSWDVSDADGDTLTCELDVNNDSVSDYTINDCANNLSQLHTYLTEGTFDAQLTVSDGNSGSDQQTITGIVVVGNGNTAPQINAFSVSQNPANPGTPVSFNWDVSDADGDTLTCELDVNNDSVSDYTINDCVNN
ncbi:MAG: PKD domain-containing protein, partial [Gammaproteobacteria bacterium]